MVVRSGALAVCELETVISYEEGTVLFGKMSDTPAVSDAALYVADTNVALTTARTYLFIRVWSKNNHCCRYCHCC